MALDIVEPEQPAPRCHIEGSVTHRDTIRLVQTAGNEHNTIGLVVAVLIHDRVHLAGVLGSDDLDSDTLLPP